MARRSKYKFATSKVGDTIIVEPLDFYSLKNSLTGYNKRNETQKLTYEQIGEPDKFGRVTFKRTA